MRTRALIALFPGLILLAGCSTSTPSASPKATSPTTAAVTSTPTPTPTPTPSDTTPVAADYFSTVVPSLATGWSQDPTLSNTYRVFMQTSDLHRNFIVEKSDPRNPQQLQANVDSYAAFLRDSTVPTLTRKITGRKTLTVHGWPARQIDFLTIEAGKTVSQGRFVAFTIPGVRGVFDVILESPKSAFGKDAELIDAAITNFSAKA